MLDSKPTNTSVVETIIWVNTQIKTHWWEE